MKPTTISVAMCTYNGQRYLPEQLNSILAQTRLPDEMVICDDASTDDTPALLEAFAGQAPFPVRLVRNATTLGSTRNFEQAIGLCKEDLIALADQDDVWEPQRLQVSEAELQAHPGVGLVFCDGTIVNGDSKPSGQTLWQSFGFTPRDAAALGRGDYSVCLRSRFATGATVMFRAGLRDAVLPVGAGWIHDEWITAAVPLFADLQPIAQPLVRYRLHASQQVGVGETSAAPRQRFSLANLRKMLNAASNSDRARYLQLVAMARTLTERFAHTNVPGVNRRRLAQYQSFTRYFALRPQLPENRLGRLCVIAANFFLYVRHASLGQFVRDIGLRRLWAD